MLPVTQILVYNVTVASTAATIRVVNILPVTRTLVYNVTVASTAATIRVNILPVTQTLVYNVTVASTAATIRVANILLVHQDQDQVILQPMVSRPVPLGVGPPLEQITR
jgi:hypothetical protein